MKKNIFAAVFAVALLASCSKEQTIIDTMSAYNVAKETEGYHFGDKIEFPKEITDNAESISISFGDKETADLVISPEYFTLGDNAVTILIRTKSGEDISVDAVINVFSKNEEKDLAYELVAEYNHNTENFTQGFELEGNTIYESNGQYGKSNLQKYTLGSTEASVKVAMDDNVFAEGSTIVGNKIYQLSWMNRKGFIYDKNTLQKIGEFFYPNRVREGWGLTYDGKYLLLSDGTKSIYYLSPENTQEIVKMISVAGRSDIYEKINELEYHQGFIYANVWQRPYVLKINPENGEVVGRIDLSSFYREHVKGSDDVLNGIAFRGENMLVTGKLWNKIYEIKIKK